MVLLWTAVTLFTTFGLLEVNSEESNGRWSMTDGRNGLPTFNTFESQLRGDGSGFGSGFQNGPEAGGRGTGGGMGRFPSNPLPMVGPSSGITGLPLGPMDILNFGRGTGLGAGSGMGGGMGRFPSNPLPMVAPSSGITGFSPMAIPNFGGQRSLSRKRRSPSTEYYRNYDHTDCGTCCPQPCFHGQQSPEPYYHHGYQGGNNHAGCEGYRGY